METLFIRMVGESAAQWALYDGASRISGSQGALMLSAFPRGLGAEGREVVLLAPGADVLLAAVDVPAKQRRHLKTILPYLLEDQLAEEIGLVHVAAGVEISAGRLIVGGVRKSLLAQWLDLLGGFGLKPISVVPETALVPAAAGAWVLLCDGHTAWLRMDAERVFAVEQAMIGDLLKAGGTDTPVDCLLLDSAAHDGTAQAFAALSGVASLNVKKGGDAMAVFCGEYFARGGLALNLLQGEFSPASRKGAGGFGRLGKMAAVWAVAMLALVGLEGAYFSHKAHEAQEAQTALYQQLFPADSKIVDPVSQMKAHLSTGHAVAGSGFLSLAGKLAAQWQGKADLQMQSMTYKDDEHVMTLGVSAKSIEAINAMARQLGGSGLEAKVVSVVSDKDSVKGQLVLKEVGP